MINISREKLYNFSKKYINSNNVKIFLLFIPLTLIILKSFEGGSFDISKIFDVSILTSFTIVFICDIIANTISKFIMSKCEDAAKLTFDYASLISKYIREKLFKYDNITFPTVFLASRKIDDVPFSIQGLNDGSIYSLPKQIADNSGILMSIHSESIIYNNQCVRVNDIRINDNEITINYGKTSYFDSLITNRAMDYVFKDGKSIREIFEPGPFLNKLSESKLSNHLGFNGLVELNDGNIIFIKRSSKVSIGKNIIGTSVGASYKVKYGVDDNFNINSETISNAIRSEIFDELKIKVDENLDLTKNIYAFYRDLVEGGKPQFVFYYKCSQYDKNAFLNNFNNAVNKRDKKKLIVDGTKFEFINVNDFCNLKYEIDGIILPNKTKYKMTPSAVATICLLCKE